MQVLVSLQGHEFVTACIKRHTTIEEGGAAAHERVDVEM